MGHNRSWISKNQSEHALYQVVTRAYSEEQTYRHFTIAVQVVIFIGSLLGQCVCFRNS
uniref:Uncharacterized protein n=1 Tax=Apteryx owenii TaxID=8824 RepID=A0A8B9S2X1_APTOW